MAQDTHSWAAKQVLTMAHSQMMLMMAHSDYEARKTIHLDRCYDHRELEREAQDRTNKD